jgi:hypothetical protein
MTRDVHARSPPSGIASPTRQPHRTPEPCLGRRTGPGHRRVQQCDACGGSSQPQPAPACRAARARPGCAACRRPDTGAAAAAARALRIGCGVHAASVRPHLRSGHRRHRLVVVLSRPPHSPIPARQASHERLTRRDMARARQHEHAPVGGRRTIDRLTDAQRAFNRLQAGLLALVEQSIAHLAGAWALRRWRGLLYRVRDVFSPLARCMPVPLAPPGCHLRKEGDLDLGSPRAECGLPVWCTGLARGKILSWRRCRCWCCSTAHWLAR